MADARRCDLTSGLLVGDLRNADADSEAHRLLLADSVLDDTLTLARHPQPDWGSFSQYRAPRVGLLRLDWILVSNATVVEVTGVNPARFDGVAVSDHEPVQALLRFDAPEAS